MPCSTPCGVALLWDLPWSGIILGPTNTNTGIISGHMTFARCRIINDISSIIILISHRYHHHYHHHYHPVCRLAWATLGRDVEYAFKIGEQTIIFLTIIITNRIIISYSHYFNGFTTRKWFEAHEQLSEGQHDDTSALLQHHEEVLCSLVLLKSHTSLVVVFQEPRQSDDLLWGWRMDIQVILCGSMQDIHN